MIKQCVVCTGNFNCGPGTGRASHCITCSTDCSEKHEREWERKYKRYHLVPSKIKRFLAATNHIGEQERCRLCPKIFIRATSSQIVCPECKSEFDKTRRKEWRIRNRDKLLKNRKEKYKKMQAAIEYIRDQGVQI